MAPALPWGAFSSLFGLGAFPLQLERPSPLRHASRPFLQDVHSLSSRQIFSSSVGGGGHSMTSAGGIMSAASFECLFGVGCHDILLSMLLPSREA